MEPRVGIHATSLLIEVRTLLIVTVFVLLLFFLFLSDASITLKVIPGVETVWLHNNKVSAWREKHAAEARITKAKYVCIYMKTNPTPGWPEHRRIRSHFQGKQLNVIKLIRISNLDKNWRLGRVRWFTSAGFNQCKKRLRVSIQNAM